MALSLLQPPRGRIAGRSHPAWLEQSLNLLRSRRRSYRAQERGFVELNMGVVEEGPRASDNSERDYPV